LLLLLSLLALPRGAQAVVEVRPGDDLQAAVDAQPPGTEFRIRAGVHRLQQVRPKDGDVFTGEPGAVLSGAVVLEGWRREGDFWVVEDQPYRGQVHGSCEPGYEGCRFPEDLFLDDEPLRRVTRLSDLDRPEEWFFDTDGQRIFLLADPRGARVELGVTRHAFYGDARDVVIQGLVIEKYAPPAQHGAVHGLASTFGPPSRDWTLLFNTIRWNHGMGVRTSDGMRVIANAIVGNGQLGIGGSGDDVLVEGNLIAWNNTAGFNPNWEAGGSKFVGTRGLRVRFNYVEGNWGPGLWTDIDNEDVLYENNWVFRNTGPGIFHEISQSAVIRDNQVEKNGTGFDAWLWGAQILVSTSRDVEIYGNQVVVARKAGNGITLVQQDRGSGRAGRHVTTGNFVHDNSVVYLGEAGMSGAAADFDPETLYGGHNRFRRNSYYSDDRSGRHWAWRGALDWRGWRRAGQDADGRRRSSPLTTSARRGGRCGLDGGASLALLALLLGLRRRADKPTR
jgi:hypothetical protein